VPKKVEVFHSFYGLGAGRKGTLAWETGMDLAAILAYGEGRQKPGRLDRDFAEQIKMVAGVRFIQGRTSRTLRKYV
jgi:hypothetical protein